MMYQQLSQPSANGMTMLMPQHQQQQMLSANQMQLGLSSSPMMDTKPVIIQSSGDLISGVDLDKEKEKQARENHCEIERRRRVKMAAYFNELCVMVPTCSTLQRKPDKLTILRMASSHMRNLRGAGLSNNLNLNNPAAAQDNAYKPSFLTDQELKHLILEAADGFLFVAQCDTGNIIYASDAIEPVLSYTPNEWYGHSLFEFIHMDDLEKVKDQLSTQENSSNSSVGRILDLKTGTVKKEGHPNSMRSHIGSRRSFICRVKLGPHQQPIDPISSYSLNNQQQPIWSTGSRVNRNRNTLQTNIDASSSTSHSLSNENKPLYSVLHITGYTKVWPPNAAAPNNQQNMYHQHLNSNLDEQHQNTNFHLIAIARIQMTSAPTDLVNSSNFEFITRHDQNGAITFVDQRVTGLLGYKPADMLKKNLSEFCIAQDQQLIKEQLKVIYDTKQTQPVQMNLHFVSKNNNSMQQHEENVIKFKTSAYAFLNPCNDSFEFIVCTHVNQKFNELNSSNSNLIANNNRIANSSNQLLANNTTTSSEQYSTSNQYAANNLQVAYQMNSYANQGLQQQSPLANQQYGNYLMMQNATNATSTSNPWSAISNSTNSSNFVG